MESTITTTVLIRFAQAALAVMGGLYMLTVALGNVTDYHSNFLFVRHVMSMDTTLPGNSLMYRAITSAAVHHGAYWLIIATEFFTAFACLAGAWMMLRQMKSDAPTFHRAKRWALVGILSGLVLFFFGFQVVAGEWFAMWQSDTWNGLDSAFRLTTFFGIALVALMLKDE